MARVKAISSLLYLKDEQHTEKLKGELGQSLYVNEFELIKAGNLAQNLEKCDKLALVRSLLLSNGHDDSRLQLICKIAYDNRFLDEDVWENVLEPLYNRGQTEYLEHLFTFTPDFPQFTSLNVVKRLYPLVLIKNLSILIQRIDFNKSDFNAVVQLLQKLHDKCELVIPESHLDKFYNDSMTSMCGMKMIAMFYILQRIATDSSYQSYLQIVQNGNSNDHVQILDQLLEYSSIPAVVEIKDELSEMVFQAMVSNNTFCCLENTKHKESFDNYKQRTQ